MSWGKPCRSRNDTSGRFHTQKVGSGSQEGREELRGHFRDSEGFGGWDGILRGGCGVSTSSGGSRAGCRRFGSGDEDVHSVSGGLGVGNQRSGENGSMVNLVVAVNEHVNYAATSGCSRVTEEVSETHDGVLAVLDKVRFGTVTNVLPRSVNV